MVVSLLTIKNAITATFVFERYSIVIYGGRGGGCRNAWSTSGRVADAKNPIQFDTSAAAFVHPFLLTV